MNNYQDYHNTNNQAHQYSQIVKKSIDQTQIFSNELTNKINIITNQILQNDKYIQYLNNEHRKIQIKMNVTKILIDQASTRLKKYIKMIDDNPFFTIDPYINATNAENAYHQHWHSLNESSQNLQQVLNKINQLSNNDMKLKKDLFELIIIYNTINIKQIFNQIEKKLNDLNKTEDEKTNIPLPLGKLTENKIKELNMKITEVSKLKQELENYLNAVNKLKQQKNDNSFVLKDNVENDFNQLFLTVNELNNKTIEFEEELNEEIKNLQSELENIQNRIKRMGPWGEGYIIYKIARSDPDTPVINSIDHTIKLGEIIKNQERLTYRDVTTLSKDFTPLLHETQGRGALKYSHESEGLKVMSSSHISKRILVFEILCNWLYENRENERFKGMKIPPPQRNDLFTSYNVYYHPSDFNNSKLKANDCYKYHSNGNSFNEQSGYNLAHISLFARIVLMDENKGLHQVLGGNLNVRGKTVTLEALLNACDYAPEYLNKIDDLCEIILRPIGINIMDKILQGVDPKEGIKEFKEAYKVILKELNDGVRNNHGSNKVINNIRKKLDTKLDRRNRNYFEESYSKLFNYKERHKFSDMLQSMMKKIN